MEPRTLAEVVGQNFRAAREEFDLTLSSVSVALQAYGVSWTAGRLANMEAAKFVPNVQHVLLLSSAMTAATGYQVRPCDLLESDGPVAISDSVTLTSEAYADLVSGDLDSLTVGHLVDGEQRVREAFENAMKGVGPGVSGGNFDAARLRYSLADSRAAKKLNLGRNEFIGASLRRWGRLLSEETEMRAPEGATAQKKGRITRELIEELRERMDSDLAEAKNKKRTHEGPVRAGDRHGDD